MSEMAENRPSPTSDAGEVPVYVGNSPSAQGVQANTVRDVAEGKLMYPSHVPPQITSPGEADGTASAEPASKIRSASPQVTPESREPPPKSAARPAGRHWDTELPTRGARRASWIPPVIKRAGTNVSQLNGATWNGGPEVQFYGGDTSESESSSDDEPDTARQRGARPSQLPRRSSDERYRKFRVGNDNYRTKGKVSRKDGRLDISVKDMSNTGYLAKALGMAFAKVLPSEAKGSSDGQQGGKGNQRPSGSSSASTVANVDSISCPKLNIVIMVIGSRGDAQPFLKIGKVLKEQYGHRVRIATHPAFRDFVEKDSNLEFFSVGGDPSELMSFMVKNPGMIPTLESVKAGDIGRRRAAMATMFDGFWRACINSTDDEKDLRNLKMMGNRDPFIADAIIANPPSFAHMHCAEALGIPLHLMFTFPYTPTQAFPHPLASIKKTNVDPGYTNFISYPLVEMMVWQGLGDLVNDFRVGRLGLDPVSTLWAPGATYRLHVPFTYLWSPGLVPKPEDWGKEIDVSGFVFLDLASSFKPPDPLVKFLESGEAPVYIGFGSIMVDDADRFTQMIFEAVKLAGVRALVSKGWGGLGGDSLEVPENIFMLDNTPHDWLFPKVRACVIHGGAGTTAIALACGKPTFIVPFFGDQHFWGSMVGTAGAGPEPVPYKQLSAEKLAEGIKYCLTEEAATAVTEIARRIEREGDGAENACRSFHTHLALSGPNSLRCSLLPDRVAAWQLKNTNLRLSPLAADYIVGNGYASWKGLRLLRHVEWNDFEGPGEPVSGIAGSLMSSVGGFFGGVGGIPYRIAKANKKRRERKEEKKTQSKKNKKRSDEKASQQNGKHANGALKESVEAKTEAGAPATQAIDHATKAQETLTTGTNGSAGPAQPQPTGDEEEEEEEEDLPQRIETSTTNALRTSVSRATASTTDADNPAKDVVKQIGRGTVKSAAALARAPVDLSVALAQGFHNAPRLYGDDTVRPPPRVTGIRSGLKAAGHEFAFGIYDGWTGMVRLPVRGAKQDGVTGLVKGVGMGLTGFVLKDIAALVGPVGYTLKGLVKQVERSRQPARYVRRARIMQGQRDMDQLGGSEREAAVQEVARGWEVMRALWETLETQERRRGSLRSKLGAKRRWGMGPAFESVETAERVLAAVRKGETVESVVGKGPGRKSKEGGRKSLSACRGREDGNREAGDEGAKGRTGGGFSTASPMEDGNRKGRTNAGNAGKEAKISFEEAGEHAAEGDATAGTVAGDALHDLTPGAEHENPFSHTSSEVAKNKAENETAEKELAGGVMAGY